MEIFLKIKKKIKAFHGDNMKKQFFRINLSGYSIYPSLRYLSQLVLAYVMLFIKIGNAYFYNGICSTHLEFSVSFKDTPKAMECWAPSRI